MKRAKGATQLKTGNETGRIFLMSDQAIIEQKQRSIRLSDLRIGDRIVVVGSARDDKRIEARMVLVIPF